MNSQAPNEPVAIPSLQDAESQRLASRMIELARTLAATKSIDDFAATGWPPHAFFDTLEQLHATYDAYVEHNIAASALKIMCQFGCTRRCHQAVQGCYAFEITSLYRQLRTCDDYGQINNDFVRSTGEFQTMFARYAKKAPVRDDVAASILADLNDRLALPYSEFLAQGLAAFAARGQFRLWGALLATA